MDVINSFFQNIKDKLTNPFFGTLSFIIIIHHWEFWYTIFNFDDKISRIEKLTILRCIGKFEFTCLNIFVDVLYALGIVIIGYLVVVATRALSIWIEYQVMPFITNTVSSKLIIAKSDYDEVVKERTEYAEKYEEQRKNVRELSKDFDTQTQQIGEKDKIIIENTETITEKELSIFELTSNLADFKKKESELQIKIAEFISQVNKDKLLLNNTEKKLELNLKYIEEINENLLSGDNENFWLNTSNFPPSIVSIVDQLKNSDKWNDFLDAERFIKNRGGNISSFKIREMIELGLILDNESDFSVIGSLVSKYNTALRIAIEKDLLKNF